MFENYFFLLLLLFAQRSVEAQVRNCVGSKCYTCASQTGLQPSVHSAFIEYFVDGRLLSAYVKYDSLGIIEMSGLMVPEIYLDSERIRREIQFLQAKDSESKQLATQLENSKNYTLIHWSSDPKESRDFKWTMPSEKNPGYGLMPPEMVEAFKKNEKAPRYYEVGYFKPDGTFTTTYTKTWEEGLQITTLNKKHERKNSWVVAKNSEASASAVPNEFQKAPPPLGSFIGRNGVVSYSLIFARSGKQDMETPQVLNYRIGNDPNVQVQSAKPAAAQDSVWQQTLLIQDLVKEITLRCSSSKAEEVALRLEAFQTKKEPPTPEARAAALALDRKTKAEAEAALPSGGPGFSPFATEKPILKVKSTGNR